MQRVLCHVHAAAVTASDAPLGALTSSADAGSPRITRLTASPAMQGTRLEIHAARPAEREPVPTGAGANPVRAHRTLRTNLAARAAILGIFTQVGAA